MIANYSSTTDRAGTFSYQAHQQADGSLNKVDPDRSTRSENLEYSNLNAYELAIIWLKASAKLAPSSLAGNATVLELLLLRLTLDDRVLRTASESADSQRTSNQLEDTF